MEMRRQTLERMCNCDCNTPPFPPPPSPFPGMPLSVLEEHLYKIAHLNGYEKDFASFGTDFALALSEAGGPAPSIEGIIVQKGSVEDFPAIGQTNALYIDTENRDIYFWDDGYYRINTGSGAGLADGTILNGGNASQAG